MPKPILIALMLIGLLLTVRPSVAEPFFKNHARGWHWYEVLPLPHGEERTDEASSQDSQESPNRSSPQEIFRPKTPTELVNAYRTALESRLHAAWVNPTPQNVKAYQEMQKDLMERSKMFATVWMQNVFQTPELDHTLVSPVNQQGRHLQIDLEKNRTFKVIKNLSQTFGLFLFFAGDCPYCHQFAPIVKQFAKTYGWEVIPISVDGGMLAEFPNAQQDNGLFGLWDIKALPALFAVNPQNQEAIPVAYGLTSLDEMESRLISLLGTRGQAPGDR